MFFHNFKMKITSYLHIHILTFTEARTTTMTSLLAMSDMNMCTKCSTVKKSGKRSCCALGGAWFKNCGDAGDRHFDHTWSEGIQACKGLSILVESAKNAVMLHEEVKGNSLNNSGTQNASQRQINGVKVVQNMHHPLKSGARDSENSVGIGRVTVSIWIVLSSIPRVKVG